MNNLEKACLMYQTFSIFILEKERSLICNNIYLLIISPEFYQNHLKSQLSQADLIFLKIALHPLQVIIKVNREKLVNALPSLIRNYLYPKCN